LECVVSGDAEIQNTGRLSRYWGGKPNGGERKNAPDFHFNAPKE
jgi:hypothetical protein